MLEPLVIDGAYGEGGGQILRTSLTLSVVLGRPLRVQNIRQGRAKPGLQAQHLTAVRAATALCAAELLGAELGSTTLEFRPGKRATAGSYSFDVAEARPGGSAGAVSLVLQTILLPLAFAAGDSDVCLRGGTHMAWSPPYDYVRDVWLSTLAGLGIRAEIDLRAWGWFPLGRGEVGVRARGLDSADTLPLAPMKVHEPGELLAVSGRAVAANLPAHIPQRMADRAELLLGQLGIRSRIKAETVTAACSGAGIFLAVNCANIKCGFSALGRRGVPAEAVAEQVVTAVARHRASGAAFDRYLGDQMLVPLAFAAGLSSFTVETVSQHLETNAWVVRRFGLAEISIERRPDGTGIVTVQPVGA